MNGYEALKIAIIIQIKKDYFDGLLNNKQLWHVLHTDWIINLLGDIHPDEAYKALVRRKTKHELMVKN